MSKPKDECCPKFDPKPWENKTITWKDKKFVKDSCICFMHIPLNMAQVIGRRWKGITGAKAETKDWLALFYDPSPWKTEIFMPVAKKVDGMKNVTISGTFLTKVFEGPFKDAPKGVKETEEYVKSQGKSMKKLYLYYTTCPKCAKKWGKNYVVALAQIS